MDHHHHLGSTNTNNENNSHDDAITTTALRNNHDDRPGAVGGGGGGGRGHSSASNIYNMNDVEDILKNVVIQTVVVDADENNYSHTMMTTTTGGDTTTQTSSPVHTTTTTTSTRSARGDGTFCQCRRSWMLVALLGCVCCLLLIAIIVGVTIVAIMRNDLFFDNDLLQSSNNDEDDDSQGWNTTTNSTTSILPTLQRIQERGYLRCSASKGGFTEGLCQAIAGAIFGVGLGLDDDRNMTSTILEVVSTPWSNIWNDLHEGCIDLSVDGTTFTMNRDVYGPAFMEDDTNNDSNNHGGLQQLPIPATFSTTPFIYTGTRFYGLPEYVTCADERNSLTGTCRQLSVCVASGTTTEYVVHRLLDGSQHVYDMEYSNSSSQLQRNIYSDFINGKCNVFATVGVLQHEQNIRDLGYTGEFTSSTIVHSKEPLSIMTRQDDVEFSDFVNWVLNALITAEAYNITQESIMMEDNSNFPTTTDVFGSNYTNIFQNAIATVGNIGELWDRTFPGSRPIVNTINNGSTGLLYSFPFGDTTLGGRSSLSSSSTTTTTTKTDTRSSSSTLEAIQTRKMLRCGIVGNRPGFATHQQQPQINNSTSNGTDKISTSSNDWDGMDIDMCRGIAAATFGSHPTTTDATGNDYHLFLVELANATQGFVALTNDEIDVYAGAPYNLQNDVNEPTTGVGYAFSPIYYYDQQQQKHEDGRFVVEKVKQLLALATREDDDPQWIDFVRWIVFAIIYAEEEGITSTTATSMPVLELFGSSNNKQAFRDLILTVGNYGDIYQRNLEDTVPRSGRNLLRDTKTPLCFPFPLEFY